jgi:biopolymer transport protein ExbB
VLELLKPWTAITELIDGGGPFVIFIFLNGVVMWALCFERYWYYARVMPKQADAMHAVWAARADHVSWCARQIRRTMVSRLNSSMTASMPVLRVMVPLAPLLGLIGGRHWSPPRRSLLGVAVTLLSCARSGLRGNRAAD